MVLGFAGLGQARRADDICLVIGAPVAGWRIDGIIGAPPVTLGWIYSSVRAETLV